MGVLEEGSRKTEQNHRAGTEEGLLLCPKQEGGEAGGPGSVRGQKDGPCFTSSVQPAH